MITPNSSDGTNMAIDYLRKAWMAMHDARLTIIEINDGDYTRQYGPIEFNVDTCTELRQWIQNCADKCEDLLDAAGWHREGVDDYDLDRWH